jgi:hypothetical protein
VHPRFRLAVGERRQCIRPRRTSVCSIRIALLLAPSGLADRQTAGRNRSDFAQPLMKRQSIEAQALPTTLATLDLLLVPQPLWYKRQNTFQQIKILSKCTSQPGAERPRRARHPLASSAPQPGFDGCFGSKRPELGLFSGAPRQAATNVSDLPSDNTHDRGFYRLVCIEAEAGAFIAE